MNLGLLGEMRGVEGGAGAAWEFIFEFSCRFIAIFSLAELVPPQNYLLAALKSLLIDQ